MRVSRIPEAFAAVALALTLGCSESTRPVGASAAPPAPGPGVATTPTSTSAAPPFPALTRAGVVYRDADDIYAGAGGGHVSRLASRYVLYADSTFGLQFSSSGRGFFEYRGRFVRVDSLIDFRWNDWNAVGPWGSTGVLRGDSLRVKYGAEMADSDFRDGLYLRAP